MRTSETRQVARGRVRIFLECLLVRLDHLKRRTGRPPEKRTDLEILVWVHLNVVNLRIPSHGSARREHAGITLRPDACRMDIRKIHAPLRKPDSFTDMNASAHSEKVSMRMASSFAARLIDSGSCRQRAAAGPDVSARGPRLD